MHRTAAPRHLTADASYTYESNDRSWNLVTYTAKHVDGMVFAVVSLEMVPIVSIHTHLVIAGCYEPLRGNWTVKQS